MIRSVFRLFAVSALMSCLLLPSAMAGSENQENNSLARRQKVEILGFFLKDPGKARVPTTPIAVQMFNDAVEFYEKKEYDLASEALKDSLEYDPRNQLAYELLGDISYLQQRLAEAKEYYKKAYELGANSRLRDKLSKLREEASVERGMSTYRERHFIVKYKRDNKMYDGFDLRELLRETYRDISKDMGHYLNHQVVVLLYDREEFQQLTSLPHWAAGVYDGKIRMPAYQKNFKDRDLRALTAHEVTHVFVASLSNGRAPAWINEGLAEYQEDKVRRDDRLVLRSALKTGSLLPMDVLLTNGGATSLGDPLQVSLFYDQSFSLVSYLVERYGMFRVKKMLESFGKGKDSHDAIRSVLKISPEMLEKDWLASLRSGTG